MTPLVPSLVGRASLKASSALPSPAHVWHSSLSEPVQRILHRAGTTRIRERAQRCASWTGPPSRARGDLVVDALDGVAEADPAQDAAGQVLGYPAGGDTDVGMGKGLSGDGGG